MENPYVNILGHPDDSRFPLDYEAVVRSAKEQGYLELNNNSLHPLGARQNPLPNDIEMLEYCMKYGSPIILGSDAHTQEDVGNHKFVQILLEELDFQRNSLSTVLRGVPETLTGSKLETLTLH